MSMRVNEYDSDEDSYGNNGVGEERVSWRMEGQPSSDKYMCMQGQMNHHQPPHHHMQSPSGSHRMGGQFQPQYFPQSTQSMHQYGHIQHQQQQPQQKSRQMGSGYMVDPMPGEPAGRCDVMSSAKSSANPSPSMGSVVPKPSQHQFVMGTVKRRGRPPKPESEKKPKREPKPRGRPPRSSLLQVAIGSKKPSNQSTTNSQNPENTSLQESPFPLLPSAFASSSNTDSGKKSRGRPRIHPQKDPGMKRPRGRPRVTPLVGEAAWKAECGKLKRNLKKKDEIIAAMKAKLIELGQPVDEIIAMARNNREQAGNSGEEDEDQNGASSNVPQTEGATSDEPQKYHGYYGGGDESRNNGNNQSTPNVHRDARVSDYDDDEEEEEEDEDEVEEVNISSNTSMSNNPHNNNDNDDDDDDEEEDDDDDDDNSRGFD